MVLSAAAGLVLNLLYALYHGILGIVSLSLWLITMCAYYTVLGSMRLSAVLCEYRNGHTPCENTEYFVMTLSGILLLVWSFILSGIIYISISQNIAAKRGEITMITIAAYTLYKIIMTAVKAVKQRKNSSPLLAVIRNIGCAEAAASVFTLQRSMLVSFGSMPNEKAHIMNILTGGRPFASLCCCWDLK